MLDVKIEIITSADNNPVAEFFSSSSTPETDACKSAAQGKSIFDLSKKLERERDEAREVASGLAQQAERLRKERDEARKEVEYYKARYDVLKESW